MIDPGDFPSTGFSILVQYIAYNSQYGIVREDLCYMHVIKSYRTNRERLAMIQIMFIV